RDEEHDDEREDTQQWGADTVKDRGAVVDPGQQADEHAPHHNHQGQGPVVGADLLEDTPGSGKSEPWVHADTSFSIRARKACSASRAPVRASNPSGVSSASRHPSRSSSSRLHLVASSMTWLDTSSVVPSRARRWNRAQRSRRNSGSSPTVGSSRTSSSGDPTRAAPSETRERWPPESRSTGVSASVVRSTVSMVRSTASRGAPARAAK